MGRKEFGEQRPYFRLRCSRPYSAHVLLHFFQFEKKWLRPLKVACLGLSFLVTFDLTASNTLHLCVHSVLERIWIKGSYLSQWLPQGERGHPKESKSRWIEILHGGSQFTLWFLKIKNFQKFSNHSEILFCFTILKKLNKSCSLEKKFLFLKKKC